MTRTIQPYVQPVFGQSWRGYNALQVAQKLGIASGLDLALDAGDAVSYPGSGQNWANLAGSDHFQRGTTPGADSGEPSFSGTSGRMSQGEYFVGNATTYGGQPDGLFVNAGTIPSWHNALHKANVKLTIAAWARRVEGPLILYGGRNNNSAVGIKYSYNEPDDGTTLFRASNGSSSVLLQNSTITAALTGEWGFFAVRFDDTANDLTLFLNDQFENFSVGYASPSAAAATYMNINGQGNIAQGRNDFSQTWVWSDRCCSRQEILALYQATRGRYSA